MTENEPVAGTQSEQAMQAKIKVGKAKAHSDGQEQVKDAIVASGTASPEQKLGAEALAAESAQGAEDQQKVADLLSRPREHGFQTPQAQEVLAKLRQPPRKDPGPA